MLNETNNPPDGHHRGKKILEFVGIIICAGLVLGIIFCFSVFKEVNKYRIVITPGSPSAVSIEPYQ